MARSTDQQTAARIAAAAELLAAGTGSALTAQLLSERFGVSLRQARRYVSAGSFDVVDAATPAELDRQAMLSLYRLDLVAGRAMAAGDEALAIRATKAHASALSAFRRAITAPAVRFRLPTATTRAAPDPPPDCPF